MDERVMRAYRNNRSDGMTARQALWVAKGNIAYEAMDYDCDRSGGFNVVERDGLAFQVHVEFDYDAWREYSTQEDPETCPQWSVAIRLNGEWIDSLGGIGGGFWDGRDEASMDDAVRADLWSYINDMCDPGAVRASWVSELV